MQNGASETSDERNKGIGAWRMKSEYMNPSFVEAAVASIGQQFHGERRSVLIHIQAIAVLL